MGNLDDVKVDEQFSGFEATGVEDFGIYLTNLNDGREVAILSTFHFDEVVAGIEGIGDTKVTLLTPEMTTSHDLPLAQIGDFRGIVEERVENIISLSSNNPNQTIILGTPCWLGDLTKPGNYALTVRAGKIIAANRKIVSADLEEYGALDFSPQTNILIDKNPEVVICADLTRAGREQSALEYYNIAKSRESEMVKFMMWCDGYQVAPKIISEDAKVLFVNATWGVGSMFVQENPQDHYRQALFSAAHMVFEKHPALDEIVMCDSTLEVDNLGSPLSVKPYNYHFKRKNE